MRTRPPGQQTAAGGSSDQLRLLVEAQTDYAIFVLDTDGHVASWNPGAARIKGYTADEIIGRHFSTFYTQEDIDRRHPDNELEIARREGRYEEEGWRVRKDGTRFWARVIITALFDEGRFVGYGKVTRDMTEPREAEQQLRSAAEALAESERRARDEAERQRRRAMAVEEVNRAIVATSSLEDVVQTATNAATELTRATLGAFFYDVQGADGESFTLSTISGAKPEAFRRFPLPLERGLFEDHRPVRLDDVTKDPRYGAEAGPLPVRSYLAVPVMTTAGEVAGGLFFGHPEPGVFDQAAEDAAVSVAATAAVAIVNARLLESARHESAARAAALEERDHVAKALQQSLLPPDLPEIEGLELGSEYQAGVEIVGGDFYDVFALADRRWGVVLGDVCGSGPEAASQTALTRHSVRTAAMFDNDPAHVLQALNTALLRSGTDRFTTAVFARLEPRPGGFVVCIASGGHPPAVLCRADGSIEECRSTGPLLGIVEPVQLGTNELDLRAGDTLVFYTDGLVEARRGADLFGHERLAERIVAGRTLAPGALAADLVEAAREFSGAPVADDIAVVILRVRPAA